MTKVGYFYTDQQVEEICRDFGRKAIIEAMVNFKARGTDDEIHYLRAIERVTGFGFTTKK